MTTQSTDKLISLRTVLVPIDHPPLLEQIETFVADMEELVIRSERLVPNAEEFEIVSEAEYQFADDLRVELLSEAKAIDERRLTMTRPLDTFKTYIKEQADAAT